ncbi:MAG: LacI family DNA-binding transcriptional regulator [Spirochaetes bacterium]|nr:LacI family DNA-binding transcriptional regulator [Spirochaetota bacterium]
MIKEIARRANLSVSAVRRALKDFPDIPPATKVRVKALAAELGYRPNFLAQAIVTKKSRLIGVLVPELATSFFPEVIDGFETAASLEKYNILIAKHDHRDPKLAEAVALFGRYQVDGLCLVPVAKTLGLAAREELGFFTKPVVLFDDALEPGAGPKAYPWIGIDDEAASAGATKYLLGKGHRRLAFVGANPESTSALKRLKGFQGALRAAALPAGKEIRGPLTEETGRLAVATLLGQKAGPLAILCQNDLVASGVILECLERGLAVPGHVSVMGFGNLSFGHALAVPLTTVDQSARDLGARMFELLRRAMEGDGGAEEVKLPWRIVERASVGQASAG